MSDEVNPLIAAFLKLQDENHPNIFEAAKKAKKDYDKDGKIESAKDEVWGSRFRAAKKAGKMHEAALKDPKDPSVQGSGDVTSSPMRHVRPTNPDRIKNMKDPRDPSVQGSGDVTNNGKSSVKEGVVSNIVKGAATFASDVARAYKGGYGTSAKTATGQFTRPGPVTGAAQNIARSAGARPGAGAATGAVVGTAAAINANRPKSDNVQTSTPVKTSTPAPEKKIVSTPTPPSRPTYMSRGQAFSAARKEAGGAGGKFSYGGKEYHTGLKGEKVPSKLKPTSVKEDEELDLDGFILEALETGYEMEDVISYFEENYQLDELSRKTLTSYLYKASKDKMNKKQSIDKGSDDEETIRKHNNRSEGTDRAVTKITSEDVDLDEDESLQELYGKGSIEKIRTAHHKKAMNIRNKVADVDNPHITAADRAENLKNMRNSAKISRELGKKNVNYSTYKDISKVARSQQKEREGKLAKEDVEFSDEELAYFESVAPFDSDETMDSSTSTKSPRRTLTDEKSCSKNKKKM